MDVRVGSQAAPLVGRRISSEGELGEPDWRLTASTGSGALFRERRRRSHQLRRCRILLPDGKQLEPPAGMQDEASQFVQLAW